MADETLKFTLKVDDKGTFVVKRFTSSVDRLDKEVVASTKQFGLWRKAISGLRSPIIGLAGGAGLGLLVKSIVQTGAQFEKTMATVRGVMRATDKQFQQLKASARLMGETTEWSASQAGEALRFLGMAGFEANKAIKALPGVLDLATAGNIDLGRAADIASNALTAMQLPVEQLTRINDTFVATITRTNTDMEMMAESFRYAAPKAQAYGYEVEKLASMIGILGNAGIQGSMAGTQLSFAIGRASKVFEEAGVDGTGKDLIDALKLINEEGWDTDKVMKIFGERGGRAALVLRELVPEVENLEKKIKAAKGESKVLANIMRDNLIGDFKELKSVIESVKIDIFESKVGKLRGAVKDLIDYFREHKDELIDLGGILLNIATAISRTAVAVTRVGSTALDIFVITPAQQLGFALGGGKKAIRRGPYRGLRGEYDPWAAAREEGKGFFSVPSVTKEIEEAYKKIAQRKGKEEATKAKEVAARTEKEIKRLQKLQKEAAKVFEETRTPLEKYNDECDRLDKLLEERLINEEVYNRRLKQLREQYEKASEATKDLSKETESAFGKEMREAVMGWGRDFSRVLNDVLWDSESTFGDIVKSFGKMLTQMVLQKRVVEPFLKWSMGGLTSFMPGVGFMSGAGFTGTSGSGGVGLTGLGFLGKLGGPMITGPGGWMYSLGELGAVGLAGSLLGRWIGKGEYSGITGGLGAVGGYMGGTALAGMTGALGSLGWLGGPIGGVLGAIGGGLLGGIFGGSNAGMGAYMWSPRPSWGKLPGVSARSFVEAPGAGGIVPADILDKIGRAIDEQYKSFYDTISEMLKILPEKQRESVEKALSRREYLLPTNRTIGGGRGFLFVTRENVNDFEDYIKDIPQRLMKETMPVILDVTGKSSVEAFDRYLKRIEAAAKASANTIMEAFKATVVSGDWEDFEKRVKESVFSSVSEGMIEAVMKTEAVSRVIATPLRNISNWIDYYSTTGNIGVVRRKIEGELKSIQSKYLSELKPLFDVMSETMRDFRNVLGLSSAASDYYQLVSPRQTGGPVLPGHRYLVGEQGPEILQIGKGGIGSITPTSNTEQQIVIHNHLYIDGNEIGSVISHQVRENTELIESIRRIV